MHRYLCFSLVGALVNVLSVVYAHVYFPCHSNGLKDVGHCLGCSWTEPDASGIQSIVWRRRWQATRGEEWKQKLTTYNLEDCVALRQVTDFVRAAGDGAKESTGQPRDGQAGPVVERVLEAEQLAGAGAWAHRVFSHPDYAYINRCAYFDYQRERVHARANPTLRKNQRKARGLQNRKLRVSKRVEVTAPTCSQCGSAEVQRRARKHPVKRVLELVKTGSGIRRKVIEFRAPVHTCSQCSNRFIPETYQRIDRHYHGLKSWAMYHHVAHAIGFGVLEELAREMFGLRVYKPDLIMIRSLTARYYRVTYRKLLRSILSGAVLHVDETEVNLRTGKGYVWVFTNLEEVVFLYRPSREGDFLRELLKDFRGVLVSDFYATYDALDCPQQKCLIHLIRDMNQTLLANPFDDELRSLTLPFGNLLRAAVGTIDERGLKRQHLQKHKRDVERFFDPLPGRTFSSEAAETLRKRLVKYRDKLFIFLDYDGVPWNNNNAENAIKRFASYREKADGRLTEAGLSEFLVLLSVCHTCRYQEVSFFQFLLSGGKDVGAFAKGKQPRRLPALQLYPKGFVPPNLADRHERRSSRGADVPESGIQGQADGGQPATPEEAAAEATRRETAIPTLRAD